MINDLCWYTIFSFTQGRRWYRFISVRLVEEEGRSLLPAVTGELCRPSDLESVNDCQGSKEAAMPQATTAAVRGEGEGQGQEQEQEDEAALRKSPVPILALSGAVNLVD